MKISFKVLTGAIFLGAAFGFNANAQLTIPNLILQDKRSGGQLVMSPAEARANLLRQNAQLDAAIASSQATYPKDSMLKAVEKASALWFAELRKRPIKGIQLDPSGVVGVGALDEAAAKAQIAERLATPGLSAYDKAYTYMSAVTAFSNWNYPARLPTAEAYISKLAALGDSAAYWEFVAREAMVDTYYMLGSSADIVRHGVRAIDLVSIMPFHNRIDMFLYGGPFYTKFVEALVATPKGRAQLDVLNAKLETATKPWAGLIAIDSSYVKMGRRYAEGFNQISENGKVLGTYGKPFVANYWINRGRLGDSADVKVNDGKIRVVTVSGYGCPSCMASLHGLQRLKAKYPQTDPMFLTFTHGFWANRLVEPEEETKYLTNHFLNVMKLNIPIGIWKSIKVPNEEGGMSAEYFGPNNLSYPAVAKPTIYILDGNGMVRKVVVGFNRDIEMQMGKTIEFLEREAIQPKGVAQ